MGAGRKAKTYTLKEKSQRSSSVNCSISAKNLRKHELGGVIFGCRHNTIEESISKKLFGLPAAHISYVRCIGLGLPLFLFNYSDRKLHGVFEAASEGRLNINPHAWTEDGSECTPYPAQVRIQIRMLCQPLLEDQFGPVIADNYFQPKLFWFELDRNQTNKLISMFSSSPVTASITLPKGTSFKATHLSNQEQGNTGGGSWGDGIGLSGQCQSLEYEIDYVAEQEHKISHMIPNSGHSYSSVVKNTNHSIMHSKQDHTGKSSLDTRGLNEENRSLDKSYNEVAVKHCMEISKDGHSFLPAMRKMGTSLANSDVNWASANSCSDVGSHLLGSIVNKEVVNNHEHRVGQPAENCFQSFWSVVKDKSSSLPQKKWSDLFENSTASAEKSEGKEIETLDSELTLPTVDQFKSTWAPSCTRSGLDRKGNSLQDIIYKSGQFEEKVEFLKQQVEDLYFSVATEDNPCLPQKAPCKVLSTAYAQLEKASEGNTSWSDISETENCCLSEADLLSDVNSPDLHFIVDKILREVNKMKLNQFKQDQKICCLEKELVESRREIKSLKHQLKTSECSSLQESNLLESQSSVDESVLIIGGFDGVSFLSSLDCYSPSRDSLESLCPMSSVRSYTSAVKLNGEIYVIGGAFNSLWYDTVESYNLVNNQWVTRPSLNQKKGSLAGISLNEKIFAIGGGDGVQCFSEVELFDVNVGRWIPTESMLHKRFAPAAAEINGTIYVVGGYNGNNYLKSMERFDPRGHSWERLESMSTKRGCHSLAVLNEKLYAIGGYNGERMVSTVEVYDPRMGFWITVEPMNNPRGYSASIVIENSISVISGVTEDNVVFDKVECYKEAYGWQSTNLKAIGKRCFFSAILL